MSSPCLSGGGRTYGFDLEIVKSPSTSLTRTNSHTSSSPSSTLSESSNSPLAISTRKPRTPRKRPNQIYNEAAALLSTAYPKIFSSKHLTNPRKFTKHHQDALLLDDSPSELLWPFRVFDGDSSAAGFLIRHHHHEPEKPSFLNEVKFSNAVNNSFDKECSSCHSDSLGNSSIGVCSGYEEADDFDSESILDEEIEEGIIDSIMGNLSVSKDQKAEDGGSNWYANPMGFHFGSTKFQLGCFGNANIGMRKALRHGNEVNLWNYPFVDMLQISPRLSSSSSSSKKIIGGSDSNSNSKPMKKLNSGEKKKKKVAVEKSSAANRELQVKNLELAKDQNSIQQSNSSSGLLLKLNYDHVLNAWSDRGSPFSKEFEAAGGNDVSARLAQIDLFSENGGIREASVMRYKEKRRTRLFSKKIRYQVRKTNADQRPRMKGRFIRRPNSSSQRREK